MIDGDDDDDDGGGGGGDDGDDDDDDDDDERPYQGRQITKVVSVSVKNSKHYRFYSCMVSF